MVQPGKTGPDQWLNRINRKSKIIRIDGKTKKEKVN